MCQLLGMNANTPTDVAHPFSKYFDDIEIGDTLFTHRRTVTEVSGFVKNNPLILNGKYAQVIFREYVTSANPVHTQAEVTAGSAAAGSN